MQPPHSSEVPKYMNTYRLESKNRFNCSLVYEVLKEVVEKHCYGVKYDPANCGLKVQTVAGEILSRVKKFEFDRYRIIVFVQIGENKQQGFETAVSFLWDSYKDKLTTYKLISGSMFSSATCFGVYLD